MADRACYSPDDMAISEADRVRLLRFQREGESWSAFAGRAQVNEKTIKAWVTDTNGRTPNPKVLARAFRNLEASTSALSSPVTMFASPTPAVKETDELVSREGPVMKRAEDILGLVKGLNETEMEATYLALRAFVGTLGGHSPMRAATRKEPQARGALRAGRHR